MSHRPGLGARDLRCSRLCYSLLVVPLLTVAYEVEPEMKLECSGMLHSFTTLLSFFRFPQEMAPPLTLPPPPRRRHRRLRRPPATATATVTQTVSMTRLLLAAKKVVLHPLRPCLCAHGSHLRCSPCGNINFEKRAQNMYRVA